MFENREQAAHLLAQRFLAYQGANPLVLAIPRGGVPMGRIVADALGGELDVVLVHKLGAPGNPEFAIGAVDESGQVILNEAAQSSYISSEYLEREVQEQLARLRQRRASYARPPVQPMGRAVIVVDDGVATGTTLLAALSALRRQKPARLMAGIGVAPFDTAERLRAAVDELVCLETPEAFFAVSQFFAYFPQVSDEEVIAALKGGRQS
jgi:predicted phosphoribosyltransferase